MSSELKLPSYIYNETPYLPIISGESMSKNSSDELNNGLKMDMLNEFLNTRLMDLNTNVELCLKNQNNILMILAKLEKKLEEFQ